MSLGRRVERLETALGPTEAVCAWLEDAQTFGSLPAYERGRSTESRADHPFRRIWDQVQADARNRTRGQPRTSVEKAATAALRGATFRVALVLELNVAIGTELALAARDGHLLALILDLAGLGIEIDKGTTAEDELTARVRPSIATYAVGLRASARASIDLEARYLGGHPALFPDLVAERNRLLDDLEQLLERARELDEIRTDDPPADGRGLEKLDAAVLAAAVEARAPAIAALRVAEARITAFDLLGQSAEAVALRARLVSRIS
jgi:hypothetical protein